LLLCVLQIATATLVVKSSSPLPPPRSGRRCLYLAATLLGLPPPMAPLPAPAVPPGFLPQAATTATPPAITDGPPPRTWSASPVDYVQWEVGAGAAGTRGVPEAALHREAGAGAQATCDAPGAALRREVGAEAVGTYGTLGAALRREAGAEA
jgi:hypothetical protein